MKGVNELGQYKSDELRERREQQRRQLDNEIEQRQSIELIRELKANNENLSQQNDFLMLALSDIYEQLLLK